MFKKYKIFTFLLITIVLLSGCSETKTLNCTKNDNNDDMEITEKISIKFKEDKITMLKTSFTYTFLNEENKKSWDEIVKNSKELITNETKVKGIDIDFSHDDKKYTFTYSLNIDITKASEEELKKYGIDNLLENDITYDKTAEEYSENGYTCK